MKFLMGVSGGTAAPMGATIKYFIERTWIDDEVYLIPSMWKAMATNAPKPVLCQSSDVQMWDQIGGSPYCPSCKNTNVFDINGIDMSSEVRDYCSGFDGVIAIGGGGTTMQSFELSETVGMKFIVPIATMDNDLPCFDNTLGFATAVDNMANSICSASWDAYTMDRHCVIFSMGYHCGRVAACATKLAVQRGALVDLLQIPEYSSSVKDVAKYVIKNNSKLIVVSEGCCVSQNVAKGVHQTYDTNKYVRSLKRLTGFEWKSIVADYRQRSDVPVSADKRLANDFAQRAYHLASRGIWNQVIGSCNGEVINLPLSEVANALTSSEPVDWFKTIDLSDIKDILM